MKTNRMIFIALALTGLIAAAGCSSDQQKKPNDFPPKMDTSALDRLTAWLTGSFSSADQATGDTAFFDTRLHAIQIWPNRNDGYWLYVEQAAADTPDRPYRQRVYQVTEVNDTTFRSDIYTFDDPLRFAGDWQSANPLAGLTADSLNELPGCAVILHPVGDTAFVGGTAGTGCASHLRGAAYAVSEVRIDADGMTAWDRGYAADSTQVWGAETGGYRLDRVNDEPPPDTTSAP